MEVLKDYVLGDTIARYMQPGLGWTVGMMLFPAAMAGQVAEKSSATTWTKFDRPEPA